MINKRKRDKNKTSGPWGLIDFNFTYRKPGDTVHRHRFIQAPSKEAAEAQFEAIMSKEGIEPTDVVIECNESNT